jgi:hypothetical protein
MTPKNQTKSPDKFSRSSGARLTDRDLDRFPGHTLFDRLARVVCHAGCLPRKELYEAWEVARRVRRVFRGGRVVDLAGGHGLLAQAMILLDDSSSEAVVADKKLPPSCTKLHAALTHAWPRLAGRVKFVECELDQVEILSGDVVVSSHACGRLTDVVLERAVSARARVAVLPCCHDLAAATADARDLSGWIDGAAAIDIERALRLRRRGYKIRLQMIPSAITPKNRLLIGEAESAIPG